MLINIMPVYGQTYKAGQIFFTRKKRGFISEGINFHTGDHNELKKEIWEATHTGICLGENLGAEMQWNGFKRCDLKKYFNSPYTSIFFREPKRLAQVGSEPIIRTALHYLKEGIKYDYRLILGFALTQNPLADRFMPQKVKDFLLGLFDSKGRWVCSEAVHFLYWQAGYHEDKNHQVDPQELCFQDWLKPMKSELKQSHGIYIVK